MKEKVSDVIRVPLTFGAIAITFLPNTLNFTILKTFYIIFFIAFLLYIEPRMRGVSLKANAIWYVKAILMLAIFISLIYFFILRPYNIV